ncbi:MAG: 4-oxalocrotonate tautomerase [Aestuariivirga sp.]
MPILNMKISADRSAEMTSKIASILMEHTARILHKDPLVTSILIEYVDSENWIVGTKSLMEEGKSSFYLDIKITDETNTKAEKAKYIREVFDALAALLGNLHNESYIYVQDVRATSYGYGGKTQEYRYQRA